MECRLRSLDNVYLLAIVLGGCGSLLRLVHGDNYLSLALQVAGIIVMVGAVLGRYRRHRARQLERIQEASSGGGSDT